MPYEFGKMNRVIEVTVNMSQLRAPKIATSRSFWLGVFVVSTGVALSFPAYGQMSAAEHASHHPNRAGGAIPVGGVATEPQATTDAGAGPAQAATSGSMGGGMGDMMGDMMKDMGKAPPRELYPTLMSLPNLTPEQRKEVQAQATERMRSAAALLSKGLDRLGKAAENDDYLAMQEATAQMREALAEFESGVAAQRALAEGQPPRQVALQWFKNEMNLQPPLGVEARGGHFGVTPFHFFTMVLLIGFALAMVAMYFFKMRRAAALFGRIETDSGSPPPGSAPPLVADTKVPSA